jgi:hypothetical protein
MMEVDFLPEHLIVIGGSYVGLEFAQMYRRFGSEVTVVEMGPRLIHREDEDVSEAIKTILENEGINIRLNAECVALEKHSDKIAVTSIAAAVITRSSGRTCFLQWVGCQTPRTSVWKTRVLSWISVVTSRSMTNFARMCPASMPSAIATGEELSLTPLTTIMRSSQRIFWTVIPGA